MRAKHPLREACIILVPVLFFSCTFAQTAEDRAGPIASALRDQDFGHALELLRPELHLEGGHHNAEGHNRVMGEGPTMAFSPKLLPAQFSRCFRSSRALPGQII